MSYYGRYDQNDSDDDDDDINRSTSSSSTSGRKSGVRSINEQLKLALAQAAEAGEGDEEPEVLPPPPDSDRGRDENMKVSNDNDEDSDEEIEKAFQSKKSTQRQESMKIEKARVAMEEEERRVAALTFDEDALLPFDDMKERAKYIPLRLSYDERKSLRTVNAAINVSDYTNTIDVQFKSKARRKHVQLQRIVAFLSGIVACTSYDKAQEILEDRNFEEHEIMLRDKLEIARRYKITNPEKMRSEYGKLVYLMQDAVSSDIQPLLSVNISKPVHTVYNLLETKSGLKLLDDTLLGTATQEILPSKEKSRAMIQMEIERKNRAVKNIVSKYTTHKLKSEDIENCLYSISDNNSFLNSNRKPIIDCIDLLKKYFHPNIVTDEYKLSINEGKSGSRLSHDHKTQYNYVSQSLHLWAAIVEDTYRLWYLAEQDLLSETQSYELTNTGQGLQRVQQSPRVYRAMHEILHHTQQKCSWVGSSVIHLGDANVPNALLFIDKYTQVSRILGPLVKTLSNLEDACEQDEGLKRYMDAYGGIEKAIKDILKDFFTHAFDGSGGDNFFEAGSCIDGRLTSAWNWCSALAKKPYYPLFRLTGFLSFDGEFDK
jgi:hypothetical protein